LHLARETLPQGFKNALRWTEQWFLCCS
jgi:hypothetical protein